MNIRIGAGFLSLALLVSCGDPADDSEAAIESTRPNVLVIVADDLGFSDLGFMGSEIETPTLDALAGEGVVLTDFHVAPTCSPTRAMLLTGVDTHPAGLGTMAGDADEVQEGRPGYEGFMTERVVTIATLLRDAGYHTYMAGKWHLGTQEGFRPQERGFERSFGPIAGGASHFGDQLAMFFDGAATEKATYMENGVVVDELPGDFFSSKNHTDKLIGNIQESLGDGRPFFAYAAYTAPHWPLQAPEDYIDRYAGMYDHGWDVQRARRVEALKQRGLVPAGYEVPALVPWEDSWDSLADEEKAVASRKMELFAAMVENLDYHIGRLLDFLKESGEYDNTLIYFFSDNGAEGNLVHKVPEDDGWVARRFDNTLGNMGRPNSYVYPGPGWAQASTAPMRFYKAFPSEGGIRVPAIVAGAGVEVAGRNGAFVTVKDIAPTVLELAGIEPPGSEYRGRAIAPIEGESMVSLLEGATDRVHDASYTMGWELFGRRALRRGDWKIVWIWEPYGEGRWWLFDLASDPAETRDLADENPEKLAELVAAWDEYTRRNDVVLPASDTGYGREDPW